MPSAADPRTPEQLRYDALADQIIEVTAAVNKLVARIPAQNTQTVIHKTQGLGALGVISAAISFLCVLFVIVIVIVINGSLRDLWAWKDVHSNDIAAVKADIRQLKEKIK